MSVFSRKVRGFRLVDVVALAVLVAVIVVVYLAKTIAGSERAEIATVEKQIEAERDRIRLLQAEVAHLEQPSRIEALSTTHLGLAPIPAKNEITAEKLGEIVLAAHLKSVPKLPPGVVSVAPTVLAAAPAPAAPVAAAPVAASVLPAAVPAPQAKPTQAVQVAQISHAAVSPEANQ